MEAFDFETVVQPDGSIDIRALHLKPGDRVRLTVVDNSDSKRTRESFIGSASKYDRPFEPACDPNDWDAVRDPDSVVDPNR